MKNPLMPLKNRLTTFLGKGVEIPNLETTPTTNGELMVNFQSEGVIMPHKNNLVALGSWVEREGFLFFDSLKVPHPAGFNVKEHNLYSYVQEMNLMFNTLSLIPEMLAYATQEVAKYLNDPTMLESKSYKSEQLSKATDGKTITDLAVVYSRFFSSDKSKDRATFVELFENAGDLTRSANELAYLNDRIPDDFAKEVNKQLTRFNDLCLEFVEEYGEGASSKQIATNLVEPMAYWCEFLAAFLYNVNVLNVCFKEIEEKLENMKKTK